jgi:hypothetical protein
MARVVRGRLVALAAAAAATALAAATSSAGSPARAAKTLHFKTLAASATATLTFHREDQNSSADGKAVLHVVRKRSSAKGTLARRSGRILFPVKGTRREQLKTLSRESETAPYQEQNCAKSRKAKGRGGLTLRRVGNQVEARWAFPQAKFGFCPGVRLGRSITSAMTKLYPASLFSARRATLSLAGSKQVKVAEHVFMTYTWRATVRIARTGK